MQLNANHNVLFCCIGGFFACCLPPGVCRVCFCTHTITVFRCGLVNADMTVNAFNVNKVSNKHDTNWVMSYVLFVLLYLLYMMCKSKNHVTPTSPVTIVLFSEASLERIQDYYYFMMYYNNMNTDYFEILKGKTVTTNIYNKMVKCNMKTTWWRISQVADGHWTISSVKQCAMFYYTETIE